MLGAAEELFGEVGFSRATMDEIAQRARVGVATVYKYFGTKAAILDALIRPTLERALAEAEKIIACPPADPGDAMAELVDRYRHLRNDWSDRRLLRALSLLGTEDDRAAPALVSESDTRCRQQIRDLLLVLKGRGDVDPGLNIEDAVFVIFCVFNQHYEYFLTHENVPAQKLFADMGRRIRLLFRDWSKKR
jgi:AcrR family transcriptional regulator